MQILRTDFLIRAGAFAETETFEAILKQVREAIHEVQWPPGSGQFVLHPEKNGNGVRPIKDGCMRALQEEGWELEKRMRVLEEGQKRPGRLDAVKTLDDGRLFVVEWETGNISSSHRALNKMAVGLLEGSLLGGILILPSRAMYRYLTDRIGNFRELEPYFPLWRSLRVREGVLAVIEIEHDGTSKDVPRIRKGTDGRALV